MKEENSDVQPGLALQQKGATAITQEQLGGRPLLKAGHAPCWLVAESAGGRAFDGEKQKSFYTPAQALTSAPALAAPRELRGEAERGEKEGGEGRRDNKGERLLSKKKRQYIRMQRNPRRALQRPTHCKHLRSNTHTLNSKCGEWNSFCCLQLSVSTM